ATDSLTFRDETQAQLALDALTKIVSARRQTADQLRPDTAAQCRKAAPALPLRARPYYAPSGATEPRTPRKDPTNIYIKNCADAGPSATRTGNEAQAGRGTSPGITGRDSWSCAVMRARDRAPGKQTAPPGLASSGSRRSSTGASTRPKSTAGPHGSRRKLADKTNQQEEKAAGRPPLPPAALPHGGKPRARTALHCSKGVGGGGRRGLPPTSASGLAAAAAAPLPAAAAGPPAAVASWERGQLPLGLAAAGTPAAAAAAAAAGQQPPLTRQGDAERRPGPGPIPCAQRCRPAPHTAITSLIIREVPVSPWAGRWPPTARPRWCCERPARLPLTAGPQAGLAAPQLRQPTM
uniref:Kinesin motor domain-containing protein n=1 Tax=Macrostomum lignano TaxID=282301 RepID=A0A1I8FK42_9PLAT